MRVLIGMLALLGAAPALAAGPDQAALDDAVRLGTMATLAPLCGVRDEPWAFDLRRAAILRSTGTNRPDDGALRTAPGSTLVQGALGYAETEATENFAEQAPEATCGPLADSTELRDADAIVQMFRALKALSPPSS
ncbi:MAG: hypothetical protein ACRYHQ_17995 [Janthinobacterium lividum]